MSVLLEVDDVHRGYRGHPVVRGLFPSHCDHGGGEQVGIRVVADNGVVFALD